MKRPVMLSENRQIKSGAFLKMLGNVYEPRSRSANRLLKLIALPDTRGQCSRDLESNLDCSLIGHGASGSTKGPKSVSV